LRRAVDFLAKRNHYLLSGKVMYSVTAAKVVCFPAVFPRVEE
jgi:hypothetical protein